MIPRPPVQSQSSGPVPRPLAGLSGASVQLLVNEKKQWIVRKLASSKAGGIRLRKQIAKQKAFAAALNGIIKTPQILNEGEIDGQHYFDMEFVLGEDAVSFLRRASYEQVRRFADQLHVYLNEASSRPAIVLDAEEDFFQACYGRICEVQRRTNLLPPETLSRVFLGLEALRNLGPMRSTLCHGDFTLENLIIDEHGDLWAVDLLDAPFEHYWQDIAKLHQDLSGSWYLLKEKPIAQCVLDYLSKKVTETAVRLEPNYSLIHAVLISVTFLRILPYTTNETERLFVKERIEHFTALAVAG